MSRTFDQFLSTASIDELNQAHESMFLEINQQDPDSAHAEFVEEKIIQISKEIGKRHIGQNNAALALLMASGEQFTAVAKDLLDEGTTTNEELNIWCKQIVLAVQELRDRGFQVPDWWSQFAEFSPDNGYFA